jgi:hypothetical protein
MSQPNYTARPFGVHAEQMTAGTCEAFWRLAEDADGCALDETPHGYAIGYDDDDNETLHTNCPHLGCVGEYGDVDENTWLVVYPDGMWSVMRPGEFNRMFAPSPKSGEGER